MLVQPQFGLHINRSLLDSPGRNSGHEGPRLMWCRVSARQTGLPIGWVAQRRRRAGRKRVGRRSPSRYTWDWSSPPQGGATPASLPAGRLRPRCSRDFDPPTSVSCSCARGETALDHRAFGRIHLSARWVARPLRIAIPVGWRGREARYPPAVSFDAPVACVLQSASAHILPRRGGFAPRIDHAGLDGSADRGVDLAPRRANSSKNTI